MNAHEHIAAFIAAQTVATVCCTNADQQLHCFSCYYAFDAGQMLLYFKTSPGTVRTIRLDTLKMTDNSLGFGSKVHWKREG